jgi:ArsR family transcriptional regulator, arsenate/arsenite/antimonite-responsive transcriptional repressor
MRMKKQAANTLDESVEFFKAVADPVRLQLLNLLVEGEVCVCHFYQALDLPQSTDSRHLAYLRKRRSVVGRKEGLWVHYRLAKPVGELHRKLMACLDACSHEIEALTRDRQRLERRNCCGEYAFSVDYIRLCGCNGERGRMMEDAQIKAAVREQYGKVAEGDATCGSLCGSTENAEKLAISFAYQRANWRRCPKGPISIPRSMTAEPTKPPSTLNGGTTSGN